MIKIHVVFVFISLLFVSTTSAEESRILSIAKKIPASAQFEIFIADIAAARKQVLAATASEEPVTNNKVFKKFILSNGGILKSMVRFELANDLSFPAAMGFEFGSIDGIASWGGQPKIEAIAELNSAPDPAVVASSLEARGFKRKAPDDVWYVGEDMEIEAKFPADVSPITSVVKAKRFKLDGTTLHHAKTFAGIAEQLAKTPRLIDRKDIGAIATAANGIEKFGPLVSIRIYSESLREAGSHRWAKVSWMKGETITYAVALAYSEIEKAQATLKTPLMEQLSEGIQREFKLYGVKFSPHQVVKTGDGAVAIWVTTGP